jgi:lipoprotein-anchoring transpeptidase ErfK/SrfK
MQRILPALLTSLFTITSATAGPLAQIFDPPTAPAVPVAPPAPPVRMQQAAAGGGGFLEFLFGGGARQSAPPSYYRNAPAEPAYGAPDAMEPGARGGEPARPAMNPRFLKQEVRYEGREPAGTVVINTNERLLYLVKDNGMAVRYGIGVGRPGFTWAGTHHVSQKREWPDWTPPPEMIKRRPDLPRHMVGGPDNPLGARAMYLGSSLYRIHGSNEPWTIGQAVSSGCIRMRNEDVMDLYDQVKVGTKVVVI